MLPAKPNRAQRRLMKKGFEPSMASSESNGNAIDRARTLKHKPRYKLMKKG